ncbi:hypothetical protein LTS18_009320, partial [Coniosporium uncinatum]
MAKDAHSSPDGEKQDHNRFSGILGKRGRLGPRERIRHFTWSWFASTMSTGALAIILAQTPFQFTGLRTIGKIVYILDIVMFVTFNILLLTRFILRPTALTKSLHTPPEALFF